MMEKKDKKKVCAGWRINAAFMAAGKLLVQKVQLSDALASLMKNDKGEILAGGDIR